MTVKHILIQTYQLVILLNLTHAYVLLAANLDDFRSVAQKFIPDNLANQLTALAAQNSKYSQQMKSKDESNTEYSDETDEKVPNIKMQLTTPKKRFVIKNQEHSLDLEDLVERVRQKLEEKYKNKPKTKPNKPHFNSEESRERVRPKKKTVQHQIAKVKTTKEDTQIYDEVTTEPLNDDFEAEGKENDGMFFKEEDLTKTNDSYEDYVTPNKDNIFESDAEGTTKALKERVRENHPKNKKSNPKENIKRLDNLEYDDQSAEIKSQTRSIDNPVKPNALAKKNIDRLIDDAYDKQSEERKLQIKNIDNGIKPNTAKYNTDRLEKEYDSQSEETKSIDNPVKPKTDKNKRERIEQEYNSQSEERKSQTKRTTDNTSKSGNMKKLKGTMIPTREYFKMSSPDYYSKKAVAEKYDFNEPLPERDREPEDLKHFINPPARINKKVMLRGI